MKKLKFSLATAIIATMASLSTPAFAEDDCVIPPNLGGYDEVGCLSEGLAPAALSDKLGYIDRTGKEVIPVKYDFAFEFNEGLAVVNIGGLSSGKWGYIDRTGRVVIPIKYDDAWKFSEGLAAVKLNDKWGFLNRTGRTVIPFKYDYAESFENRKAKVCIHNRGKGYINKFGTLTSWQNDSSIECSPKE